ncbi:helix-turn-helix domain-containing protein [Nocardia asiatica]|uniref:helix-turn-helix domain-containing protein n=1 Tax=Nocardia asiatica TaxID=209252 RepID=UPI0024542F97|nr:DUF6597 domain-containing transcriptional factor [Nocardia asiatica]
MIGERLMEVRGAYQVGAHHVVHCSPQLLRGLEVLRCFGFDAREPHPRRRRKIPGGTVKIFFALNGVFEGRPVTPTAPVVGMHDRGGTVEHAGRMVSVQVQLDPLAARAFLGVPLHEFRNKAIDLADVLGPPARELAHQLAESANWAERFALVADFLRARSAVAEPDATVADALRRLRNFRGALSVAELADEYRWSSRHFSRRFIDQVGIAPKSYGSLMRFSAASTALIRTRHTGPGPDRERFRL